MWPEHISTLLDPCKIGHLVTGLGWRWCIWSDVASETFSQKVLLCQGENCEINIIEITCFMTKTKQWWGLGKWYLISSKKRTLFCWFLYFFAVFLLLTVNTVTPDVPQIYTSIDSERGLFKEPLSDEVFLKLISCRLLDSSYCFVMVLTKFVMVLTCCYSADMVCFFLGETEY